MNTSNSSSDAALQDIARRHGFGIDATRSMFEAVSAGRGGMAQFSHPEFGGSGQWMRGGMTMVSDLFDTNMRGRVDALCEELADLVSAQPGRSAGGSFQAQSSSAGTDAGTASGSGHDSGTDTGSGLGTVADSSTTTRGPFASSSANRWWPGDLGSPDSTGAQNDARYAWFAQAARLAIEVAGKVTVYDTQDHRIDGFSQAQSQGSTMGFHSQHGEIDVDTLPVVSSAAGAAPRLNRPDSPADGGADSAPASTEADVFSHIEKLAALHAKGVLTDDEFKDKKAELLARL